MRILALDLSLTACGWAKNTDLLEESGVYAPKGRGTPRLQDALDWVLPKARGCDLVVIEGYAFSARESHAHALGELGGVVRLGLHQLRIPVAEIPPACMKKFATGAGNARKDAVLTEAVKRLRYDGWDHNEADARWLLAMALVHYELQGAPQLPAVHLEGLRKVQWPELGTLAGRAR